MPATVEHRRRFTPPWQIEDHNDACFIIKDHGGQALAYVYYEEEPGRRMLVDFAPEVEQTEKLKPEDSIRKACLLRFRPILMTTMAALLAAVPLMLGTGTGSEIRQPLGYTIVGGLALSQILTLFTTPVVYLYLDRLNAFFQRGGDRRPNSGSDALRVM
jgi:hypothetical protein